jgi:hypothetical protein
VQIWPAPQLVPKTTAWKAVVDALGVQTSQAVLPDAPPFCPDV